MNQHLKRRKFLKLAATTSIGMSFSAQSYSRIIGSNNDIRVAVVGMNGRGRNHFLSYNAMPGVRVVAVCDVDTAVLDRATTIAKEAGVKIETAVDLRDLIKRDDIDVVSIATPNHLHALQTIWALEAGKDVLVEKPVSHNLWEGRQMVAAAKKYNRIVQVNLQNRSSIAIAEALAWTKAGNLGKVKLVRALCYKRRPSLGKSLSPVAPPKTVNYDLYMGPAPLAPLYRKQFHYDWHWQWATGNGDINNQGNHQLDVARRFLGDPGQPVGVFALGGRFGYEDDGETPNSMLVKFDYKTPLIFEQRGLPSKPDALSGNARPSVSKADTMDRLKGIAVGNIIECEGGYLVIHAGKYVLAQAFDKNDRLIKEFHGTENHYENFIAAVRDQKQSTLRAPILQGHLSASLGHLANISFLTGQKLEPDAIRELLKSSSLSGPFEGLAQNLNTNKVDLKKMPIQLGAALKLDGKTERFVGEHSDLANTLRKREYRSPYVVPQLA